MNKLNYTPKDFKSNQALRWCPGCGDYALINSLQKAMAELAVPPHQTVVVSGIGCSSRLPYYIETYGMHTIHGRAAAIATGVKVGNPKLSVWQISGDGDALAIGGNHFIHAIRRNVDLNMILLNNRVYGLTKGQYSPTSPRGYISVSSPFGTVEDPFRPAELVFGARGNFFARCVDVDSAPSVEVLCAAAQHKGAAVVEVLQNCVIFNDGSQKLVSTKEGRANHALYLKQGEPMRFGPNLEFGIIQDGFNIKPAKIGENNITPDHVLIHDAYNPDNTLQLKLAMLDGTNGPIALGVIRAVEAPTYDAAIHQQIADQKTGKPKSLNDIMLENEVWEVK